MAIAVSHNQMEKTESSWNHPWEIPRKLLAQIGMAEVEHCTDVMGGFIKTAIYFHLYLVQMSLNVTPMLV